MTRVALQAKVRGVAGVGLAVESGGVFPVGERGAAGTELSLDKANSRGRQPAHRRQLPPQAQGLVDRESLICDCKTGVSGAGKNPTGQNS